MFQALFIHNVVSSTGRMAYSEVKTFLKKDQLMIAKYLSITTLHNETLTLSADHLVYARTYLSNGFSPM